MATLKLGALAETLHGRSGNTVFVRGANGVIVRDHVIPRDARTPLQTEARYRMARAAEVWASLSPQQAMQWREFALSLGVREVGTGLVRAPRAQNLFTGLVCKLLQVSPSAAIPLDPPSGRFFGDAISVSIGLDVAGGVTFVAGGPNQPNVVTELLLQPLPRGSSAPHVRRYRSRAFVSFTTLGLSHTVETAPGWYAAAYRFVESGTGQETAMVFLGIVRVD